MAEDISISEFYTNMALSSIITELRDEMGKGTRDFVCSAARKRLGEKMMKMMGIEPSSNAGDGREIENSIDISDICLVIKDNGGPKITCDLLGEDMLINIHECHLIEAARSEPYVCEITQGWIESMLYAIKCEKFVIERVQTIVQGYDKCVFRCRQNHHVSLSASAAIKRLDALQKKIKSKIVLILEFSQVKEFNDFSFSLNRKMNAEIKNVSVIDGKYIAEVIIYRKGLARIQ